MSEKDMAEKKSKSRKELFEWFTEEINRRDKIIDELRRENLVLINTAIKKHHEKHK